MCDQLTQVRLMTYDDPGGGQRFPGRIVEGDSDQPRSANMRYATALVVALLVGAAASLYTPSARAAGVYIGIGLPVPAVVPVVPPYYPYARAPYVGIGYVGPRFWGYGYRGYYRYGHPGYFHRGPVGFHRR